MKHATNKDFINNSLFIQLNYINQKDNIMFFKRIYDLNQQKISLVEFSKKSKAFFHFLFFHSSKILIYIDRLSGVFK